ncbi:MAG: hypothetical protein E7338_06835 [Clostridiales bacterium]|nr:hypothetical protein [Clostridiales bacterium]
MRKLGVFVIVILAISIMAFSSMTFAFYSSARAEFSFVVTSDVGSSIGLSLVNSDNTLRPADTSAAVGHYEAATGENNEHIAVYTIGYVASGDVDIKIFVSNVVYEYADETDQNRTTLHNQRDAYLTSILKFCITMGSDQDSWTTNYMEANKGNLTPISLLSGASGSLSCKVRFAQVINDTITPVSQELIPPFYDGVKISFVLNAEVQD